MTISDDTINRALQRYHREYDRYLKLSARVAEICRTEVVEGNAIRAQVTSRAKSPKSLEGKLRRFAAAGKKEFPDIDAVFVQIRDLSGVRIATYEQRHEGEIVKSVCGRFRGGDGGVPVTERKDRNLQESSSYYRATHIEAYLSSSDVVGTYVNVADVPCEIQVCSMMAHVWNEIEHDLGYKPTAGNLSEQEKALLATLGQSVRLGDGTISNLFSETERRQKELGGAFTDVYDFVARVRGWFPGVDFGRHAGALFVSLQPLRLVTPDGIRKQLEAVEPMTASGQLELEAFADYLAKRGDTRFELDRNSSDVLLVLLLPKIGKHLAVSSAEAVTDGVTRVRWFAERFEELRAAVGDP